MYKCSNSAIYINLSHKFCEKIASNNSKSVQNIFHLLVMELQVFHDM